MSATTTQISGTETAANSEPVVQQGYNLSRKEVIPVRMAPGDRLYLKGGRCPDHKILVQGEHFQFTPPYKGRPGDWQAASAAIFEALVPLDVALHNPYRHEGKIIGGTTIGHFRVAEVGKQPLIARELDELPIVTGFRPAIACREAQIPESWVLGGPKGAVLYPGEVIVPAYRYIEGARDNFPYTYIVGEEMVDYLKHVFQQGSKIARKIKAGERPPSVASVSGLKTTKQLGAVMVTFDEVARVHQLAQHDPQVGGLKLTPFVKFKNGMALRVGGIITEPKLRAALELPPLPGQRYEIHPKPASTPEPAKLAAPAVIYLPPPKEEEAVAVVADKYSSLVELPAPPTPVVGRDGRMVLPAEVLTLESVKGMVAAMENEEVDLISYAAQSGEHQAWFLMFYEAYEQC